MSREIHSIDSHCRGRFFLHDIDMYLSDKTHTENLETFHLIQSNFDEVESTYLDSKLLSAWSNVSERFSPSCLIFTEPPNRFEGWLQYQTYSIQQLELVIENSCRRCPRRNGTWQKLTRCHYDILTYSIKLFFLSFWFPSTPFSASSIPIRLTLSNLSDYLLLVPSDRGSTSVLIHPQSLNKLSIEIFKWTLFFLHQQKYSARGTICPYASHGCAVNS